MTEQPESTSIEIRNDDSPYQRVVFNLQDFVGRGELGAVYKGTADGQDIVVKVPHTPAKNRQAEEEYAILAAIAGQVNNTGKVEPLGKFARAQHEGKTLIVMPYYERSDRLLDVIKNLLNTKKNVEAERRAVDAAIHYTQVMQAIHSIPASENGYINGPRSCTDRKIKDFYFVYGQHYILDWNVVREDAEPFRVAEIKLFGFLWHELFLGGKGKAPFDPFDDRKWALPDYPQGVISVGLRVLMARAVACNAAPNPNGADIKRLGEALTQWRGLLTQQIPPPDTAAITKMLNAFDGNPLSSAEIITAIQKDLLWRLDPDSVDLNTRADSLKIARELLQQGDAWLNNILNALEHDGANTEIPLAPDSAPLTAVHRERWQTLVNILKEVDSYVNSGDMRFFQRDEVLQSVTLIGRLLHRTLADDDTASLDDVARALTKIRENMPSESQHLVAVQKELDARQAALTFNSQTSWRLGDRLDAVKALEAKFTGYFKPLLDDLAQETLLPKFKDTVERVNNGAGTPEEAFAAYYELQAWADVINEGRLLHEQVSPWLDVLDFHRSYHRESPTHDLNTLQEVLHRWQLMQSDVYTEFHDGLKRTIQPYVSAAIAYLEEHVGHRIEHEQVTATASALERVKDKERFDIPEDLLIRVNKVSEFFGDWDVQSMKFISDPKPETAKALLEKLNSEREGILMSELFTTIKTEEQLKTYRELLEKMLDVSISTAIATDIENALAKLNDESEIAKTIKALTQDIDSTQVKLETAQDGYNTLNEQVNDINHKIEPLQQAVNQFTDEYQNITALTQKVETLESSSATREELRTKADLETVATKQDLETTNINVNAINLALGRYFDYECRRIATQIEKISEIPLGFNELLQIVEAHINLINIIPTTQFDDNRLNKWKDTLENIRNATKQFDDGKTEKKLDRALKVAEERNNKAKALLKSKSDSLR